MNPSLLLIPDRYKASKLYSQIPDTGAGDLAFTRALDTATRVNSAGLIEKVRTNVALYSEDQTNWTIQLETSVTANAAANPLNGAVTADKVIPSVVLTDHFRGRNMATMNGEITASIFLKADGYSFIDFGIFNNTASNYPVRATFDLSAETITFTNGSIGSISSVGSGWYRVSLTGSVSAASSMAIYHRVRPTDASGNYSGDGTSGMLLWGCQLESGVMTPYIGTTTTAAVSVGMTANIPRIDYTGGGCGKLLLEPQRTNVLTFSEQIDNAAWLKINTTVTANAIASPDGSTNADKLIASAGLSNKVIYQSIAPAGTSTVSVFAKAGEFEGILIGTGSVGALFNLTTGQFRANLFSAPVSTSVTNYGNGWYRCSVTITLASPDNLYIGPNDNVSNDFGITGNGTSGIFAWGAQLEVGSYPTSYINTLGASVTRSADAASKTGISSLIGQQEGTLFAEIEVIDGIENFAIWLRQSGSFYDNIIVIKFTSSRASSAEVINGAALQVAITGAVVAAGFHKIAFAYKEDDFALYVDGVQVGTDTSGTVPTCNEIYIDQYIDGGIRNATKKSAVLYSTRLTNSELASLTSL